MGKFKLILMTVMACCLSVALAGVASAAAITCGDCHGAPPVNGDNCANTGRGLHGTHVNYSSSTYKKTVASYGKCSYCHTATAATAPTTTHNNNYINITGNVVGAVNSNGLDYSTPNCTSACHKNRAQTAKWGNYTATAVGGIKLNCRSCHDDTTDKTGLSGAHVAHLNTAITVSGLGAGTNADCAACHPDNTNDLWSGGKADDGTKKAYPHASDGTNVVADNAAINGGIGATKAGLNTTCTGACHANTSVALWGDATLNCDACHYYNAAPTQAGNDAAAVVLGGSHSKHFNSGLLCSNCHTVPGDTAHVSALPAAGDNAAITLAAGTFDDGANTCSSTGTSCHGSGASPAWGNPLAIPNCAVCHNYPTVAGRDWSGNNGHVVRYDAPVVNTHLKASGFDATGATNYATQVGASGSCNLCHSAGTHRNGSIDVTGNGSGNCGGNFTITQTTSGSNVTCGSVKCHSGKTTPNWWD